MAFVIKTNEGGMWIIPQVREALARGMSVVVVFPNGDGRLTRALEALAAEEPRLHLAQTEFNFSMRPSIKTLRGLWEVRSVLQQSRADIALYHLYASALAVRVATLGMRLRKVHMIAGPLYLENKIIRTVERFLLRLDTEIIGGSDFTRDYYLELGADPRHLHSVPYGADLVKFSPDVMTKTAARAALGLPESAFVAVMVALVYSPKSMVFPGVGIKGHELLLTAWSTFA
ncbi:MAG: glycosyltransferase, partial [Propionibacteriaceae bacterium]|nr:glycosyltransferase [Propionibacteriaceae bacterium]